MEGPPNHPKLDHFCTETHGFGDPPFQETSKCLSGRCPGEWHPGSFCLERGLLEENWPCGPMFF